MHALLNWLVETISTLGYPGIFLLMAMESSIFPVPSELVMPPAGYLAQQGQMHIGLAILAGTFGSLIGAYANYYAAHYLGRPLLYRYGKYVLIGPEKLQRMEEFFRCHGEISTFIGRLLPVIRHLISIPAGLSGMNHLRFTLYTLAGAGIWCTVLAWIGFVIGKEQALIMQYSHQALLWVLVASAALIAGYIWWHRRYGQHNDRKIP
jgi:membrane protein DedA with SNARE-associated domain